MAISFFQKLRLGLRGWSRRRDEDAARRKADFVGREAGWGKVATPPVAPAPPPVASSSRAVDLEGLRVAWLDDSGQIHHYLDIETGEVIEFRASEASQQTEVTSSPRYRKVPARSAATEEADRREFMDLLEPSPVRDLLQAATSDPAAFRKALATDRKIERSWYNFKNDRAASATDEWLKTFVL